MKKKAALMGGYFVICAKMEMEDVKWFRSIYS